MDLQLAHDTPLLLFCTTNLSQEQALGLAEEELAFYDAVAATYEHIYGADFLRDLVHEVVQSVKRNLKVDWTAPHREDVKAGVRAAVRRVLIKRGVKASWR